MQQLRRVHREASCLAVVLVLQLLLIGFQVRTGNDARLIRAWAMALVDPLARFLDSASRAVATAWEQYLWLVGARQENARLKRQVEKLGLELEALKRELARAERAQALAAFRDAFPSRLIAARVIGRAPALGADIVLIDRGTADGLVRGMAVMRPGGLVGKVVACYSRASEVLLVTAPSFAAGAVTERHAVEATLKGAGGRACRLEYVQADQPVEVGEWVYTSGDDRVFPRGLPVGVVERVTPGALMRQVWVRPTGLEGGLEEVLVVLEPHHIPAGEQPAPRSLPLLPLPSERVAPVQPVVPPSHLLTDADRLVERYRKIAEAQGHRYGDGLPGSPPPNFNLELEQQAAGPQSEAGGETSDARPR